MIILSLFKPQLACYLPKLLLSYIKSRLKYRSVIAELNTLLVLPPAILKFIQFFEKHGHQSGRLAFVGTFSSMIDDFLCFDCCYRLLLVCLKTELETLSLNVY